METLTRILSDSNFWPEDKVHFMVGSDCYGGYVLRTTKARVYVVRVVGGVDGKADPETLVFTKRDDGLFRRMGWNHCTLRHGYSERMDPQF